MGFQDSLTMNLYKHQAIVPPMEWLDSVPPNPVSKIKKSGKKVKWKIESTNVEMDKANLFVVYGNEKGAMFDATRANSIWGIVKDSEIKFNKTGKKKKKYEIRVSVLDRLNNESRVSKSVVLKL
jgi:hypothetical protein